MAAEMKSQVFRVELGLDRKAKILDNRTAFFMPAGLTKRNKRGKYKVASYAELKIGDMVSFRIFDLRDLDIKIEEILCGGFIEKPSKVRRRNLKIFSISSESARVRQLETPFEVVCVAEEFIRKGKKQSQVFKRRLRAFDVKFPYGKYLPLHHSGFFDVHYTLQTDFHLLPFVHDPEWIVDTGV